jgi:TonB-linked SusC/RagA family outer membrane protein
MKILYDWNSPILRIMRYSTLTLLIFLTTFQLCFSTNSKAQRLLERKVTLSVNNVNLKKVLKSIKEQTNAEFVYSSKFNINELSISLNVLEEELHQVLTGILEPHHLSFKQVGENIIITKGETPEPQLNNELTFEEIQAFQQQKVRGVVKDIAGETIAGVSIKLKSGASATMTNAQGQFELNFTEENPVLVFSYIGFKTQEIPVDNRTTIDVVLSIEENALNEIVVVGYGTQKRSDITGSVTSVPKDRFSKLPVTNVLQAVQGVAPGITITQGSSVPGSTPVAQVRGQNSINANSGPYVVVDGIPLSKTGGSLNDINPNDIESMEILKDASAVAIYGTNGSQGVILITTKRGTTGKPIVRYSGYGGVEGMAHVLEPRSAAEYVQKYADWMSQTGQTQANPVPNLGELDNYNAGITADWMDIATQTGVLQNHNLSISGGSPDVKYFVSGDYLDQKGVIRGYEYKRASIRTNLDVNVTSFLSMGTSLFVTNNNQDGGRVNLLNATAMSPYGQVYNPDGSYKIFPMNPELLFANPLLGLTTDRLQRTTNLNGNAFAEVNFGEAIKGLKYRLNVGYSFIPERRGSYVGRPANDNVGTASTFYSETNSYTIENILTYNRDWDKHHLDVTALYSAQQRKYANTTAEARGFANDKLSFNNLSAGATQSTNSFSDRYALNSQMGRINYSYDSRYLFTLTARRDGSSVFGANTNKYGVFPSAAIGWNIGNESFMKNVDFVNSLKLRVSYGKSGNEAIPVYRTITTNSIVRYPFEGAAQVGIIPSILGNTNLLWETTLGTNLGVDFSILNNRISGTVDYYSNETSDLLLQRSLPIITGYANVFENIGKTANKGIELSLNTKNINKDNFGWESTIVFAANKNEIVDLYGDKKSDLGNRWFIGEPISVAYDFRMLGVWQTGEDPAAQDPGAKAGDLKFADLNGDGRITGDGDREVLGQTAPKWTGGFSNTLRYRSFNLNVFIQTAQGMTRNNADLNYADESGRRNTPAAVGYWTPQNQNNTRPALSYNNTRGYGYASDASYTRIKDVTLSYTFNPDILNRFKVNGLTVYASGRNLATFTDWIGWDPEANYSTRGSGDWVNNYPVNRSFIFGLNISLR